MKIFSASLENFDKVKISVDNSSEFRSYKFQIKNGNEDLYAKKYSITENYITLTLNKEINIKSLCFVMYENLCVKTSYIPLFSTKDFDDKFYHHSILGANYTKQSTIFRLWSPAASYINLILYDKTDPYGYKNQTKISMKENNGLWYVSVKGDLHGCYYNYEVNVYNNVSEVVDPYAKAVGANGTRGAIINMKQTNPEGWDEDIPPLVSNFTDAIIYEASIRDMSSHPNSGVKNKCKFLSMTENNTTNKNVSTCLEHIKELGITHVQLMPIFDFSYTSVDEKNPTLYNWGYDPQNYNVPEGSYSTDPYNPICRILELKTMIQHLHKNGICINMDVVYNHVADVTSSSFEKIFPEYYFRFYDDSKLSNGSGCGNDVASEHSMVRKFIIDSVTYWINEYHIDGLRFDLMGLLDITTMNSIRTKVNTTGKTIMIYGEGWDLDTSLNKNIKAASYNYKKLPYIGFFNDKIRNCVKGDVFDITDKGFATGKFLLEEELKNCISCKQLPPNQSINYISCHDNHTLWDKITLSCPNTDTEQKKRILKLCAAILFTSQGIPFMLSGEEFCRTKKGEANSFNKPDNINWMDWDRKLEFIDIFYYYKELIYIRKNHPAFRMNTYEDIERNLIFVENTPKNTVAFILKDYAKGDSWKDILVIYNANRESVNIQIPEGPWNVALGQCINSVNKTILGNIIELEGISSSILFKF
ncbi:type I pullulanase [Clostridium sp. DJ247]|uniref:type I pullulanase n=1 Tax=Clostridium sp. DJ247 TaxID=2726188 RepID=UPI001627E4FB|nr:type I pullulanase [Clostridium sp. DJ247]MBC2582882.1 type I pullulanase [Clostridium sp. DJ247]